MAAVYGTDDAVDARRAAPRDARAGLAATVVAVLWSCCGSAASAQLLEFVPKAVENHAWLESYGSFERDHSKGNPRGIEWDDTFFRERLTLESQGYSYDPRFLQYRLSLAGAAKQEKYDSSAYPSGGFQFDEAVEYDARLLLLPEHDYSAQVFAARFEPVYRQQASNQHDSVVQNYGASLRYQKKPWFLNGDFIDTTLDSANTESNVKRMSVDGEWIRRLPRGCETSLRGSINPSWYDDSRDLEGDSLEMLFTNLLDLKKARLSSNVSSNTFDQSRSDVDDYDTDQFAWWELMTVYLPYNFRTDLRWRYHDDTSTVDDGGPRPERRYSDEGDNVQVDLIHRLYDSLDSRYRFVYDSRDSTGGDSSLLSNSLNLDYAKLIPRGRFLANLNLGRGDLDNSGFADVINDPYTSTAVPGTFALRQQNVDAGSIVVVMRSPLPPFDTVTLVEGVHYTVNTNLQPFELEIVTLPPEFAVPGTYDFFVTYSMLGGDYELRTDNFGGGLSFDFLDQRVSPYFRYAGQRSDVLSGVFPGIPVDSDTWTTGVRLLYGPFRGRGEYQYVDWDVNPWRAWRGEVQYVGTISRTITAYLTQSYLNRHYFGGQAPYRTLEYTEETVTTSGTLTKQIFSRNMHVSVGGSWSHISGISDAEAWSANSTFVWHIGRLDVSVGLSAYGTSSRTGLSPSMERDHEMFFVNLRRQLF